MRLKSIKPVWILGLLCLFHLVANIIWLAWDKTPPAWDQAAHIRVAVLFNQLLTGNSPLNWQETIRAAYGYPPLIQFLGGVWIGQIYFVNSLFFVLAIVGVFKLGGKVFGDNWLALAVAGLFSFTPVMHDISRNFLLDLPLVAWVVWGLYFFLKSEYLSNLGWGFGWWLMLVLASLTKLNGFIYFLPMIVWAIYSWFKTDELKILRNLGVFALAYMAAVGWWWVINYQNIYSYLTGLAGSGEKLTDPMDLGQWQTWIHYFKLMFLHQLGPVPTIILVVGLIKIGREKLKRIGVLLFFVAVNYVVFTVIKNKDFRFTMPLLPVVAIVFVLAIKEMGRVGRWLAGFLAFWLGWMFINNSFGLPVKKPFVLATPTFLMDEVEWIGIDDYPVRSPRGGVWPQEKIVSSFGYRAIDEGRRERVLVLVNIAELNDNNLLLAREMKGMMGLMDFGSVGLREKFGGEGEIEKLLAGFEYVLVPEKGWEAVPYYSINVKAYNQARDYIWENKDRFEWLENYKLPNGKEMFLVRIR